MSKATTRVEGFVARDVQMGHTNSGQRIASVRVPHQRSKRNGQGGWDPVGETTWFEAAAFDDAAEALATLKKGDMVVLEGIPEATVFQAQDGARVTVKLHFATVSLVVRGGQRSGGGQQAAPAEPWGAQQQAPAQQQPQADVWGAPGASYNDETPF